MEKQTKMEKKQMSGVEFNPLRKEKIFVRFVPQKTGPASENKRHVLSGGMADGASFTLCVPVLRSTGNYKNILTNEEKDYLEKALGLDYNALSVYNKNGNNYWDNYRVRIPNAKEGLHLDLSDPEDYIKYKVLLANTDIVAPSVQERMERPQATYRFEIVRQTEEAALENAKMDATMESYKEFMKIENDIDTVRVLVEMLDGRPYDQKTGAAFLRQRVNILIQANAKVFLSQIKDPLLHAKVIIKRSVELGKVSRKADYYYLAADNTPLCESDEKPTLSVAAKFLNTPAHQDIKFLLESEVEKHRM